jgi:hypothetical protein
VPINISAVFQEEEENVMPELTLIPLSNYTVRPWDLVATRYFSGSSTIIRWRTEITWVNFSCSHFAKFFARNFSETLSKNKKILS